MSAVVQRLDRYVGRLYLSSWIVSAVFFVGLYGVYDFFQHVDDLLDELRDDEMGLAAVGALYAYQLPAMVVRVAPFLLVTAALVTLMRLQRHNEFTAMVMTGRSPQRVVRPVLALSAVFVALLAAMQETVAPAVSEERDRMMADMLETDRAWTIPRITLRDADGRLVTATDYEVGTRTVGRLNVSASDGQGSDVLVTGEQARWDDERGGWRLQRGTRTTRSVATGAQRVADEEFVLTDADPAALMASSRDPFDLSYAQLLDLSRRYPASPRWRLLRHYHLTFPLTLLLLVALALRFVLKPEPGRRLAGLGSALLAVLGLLVLDRAMQQLGADGGLQPALAAWIPVIVGGSLVVVLAPAGR